MAVCGRCGGVNITNEVCPECGLLPRSKRLSAEVQDTSVIIPQIEKLRIPQFYLGKSWNANIFWASHEGKKKDRLVNSFISQMEKVSDMFSGGILPQRSAIFIAPPGYGKMMWVFSCTQYAVTNGYTAAPFLDTMEIKRLFTLSAERPGQQYLGIEYEEYIESDILFYTVTKTEFRRGAYSVIADLLDKRARRGKITIGISRYTVYEMAQWDSSNDFKQILSPVNEVDTIKTPAIISCI